MTIEALRDVEHSFIYDLESFFWGFYWECVHYDGSGKYVGLTEFKQRNYTDDRQLAWSKSEFIGGEHQFFFGAE